MTLRYSFHALARMSQRGINRSDVELAIANAHTIRPSDGPPGRRLVIGEVAGINVVVVLADQDLVVTAWKRVEPTE